MQQHVNKCEIEGVRLVRLCTRVRCICMRLMNACYPHERDSGCDSEIGNGRRFKTTSKLAVRQIALNDTHTHKTVRGGDYRDAGLEEAQ